MTAEQEGSSPDVAFRINKQAVLIQDCKPYEEMLPTEYPRLVEWK